MKVSVFVSNQNIIAVGDTLRIFTIVRRKIRKIKIDAKIFSKLFIYERILFKTILMTETELK